MSQATPVLLTQEEQDALIEIVRQTITHVWKGQSFVLPEPPTALLNECFGAFVTLNRKGRLRGCIGNIIGQGPLCQTIARMAYAAAFEDPRFPPLQEAEWNDIEFDISVLGPLSRCPDAQLIEIGRHGLFLKYQGHSGVFLPQVPVEQRWNRLTYLQQLCAKAGLPSDSWNAPGAELYWYEAFVFSPVDAS